MYKSIGRALLMAVFLLGLLSAACAQTAEDITQMCLYNGSKSASIKDESYRTVWKSSRREGVHSLTVEAPEGQTIGGLLIRWRTWPLALKVEARDELGQWYELDGCEADFVAQYIPADGQAALRLTERDHKGNVQLEISSITVLPPGELPADVQVWEKPKEKVDLMLLSAHPDDEVLWFGGLLPDYAGAQGKEVLVVNSCYVDFDRRLELLDCLWTCGVRTYPVFLGYADVCTNQRDKILQRWGWDNVLGDVVALYRQYRPDVVMLHDVEGEYGHGAHRALSLAGREAADAASDASYFAQSAEQYGIWNVPKVYVHLYPENVLQLDWHVPLEAFGGKTAYEMAALGFQCHRSQNGVWSMENGKQYDNSLFGLWRSTVGPDRVKTNLFENMESDEQ